MKRPAFQKKQVVVLRMAFRARKGLGTFEKRAPGPYIWHQDVQWRQQEKNVLDSRFKSVEVYPVKRAYLNTQGISQTVWNTCETNTHKELKFFFLQGMKNQRVYLLPEIFVTSRTLMPYMITNKGFPVKKSAFLTEFGVFDFHASVVLWYNATWVIICK